jgi:hypothetical protein
MGKAPREQASELRAVAPLVVLGGATPKLVGPCTLVTNGAQTIAFSSSELLRTADVPLAICTKLDGSQTVAVTAWAMGRHGGIGIIELAPFTPTADVVPLQIAAISATVDTRSAPSGLVIFKHSGRGFARAVVSVYVDAIDGGGMSDDVITRLASPIEAADADLACDGATLFTWMPADPVLGRPSEVVAVALGCTYRAHTFKPRAFPAVAELSGLEDLGYALPWSPAPEPEASNELGQVAGEIRDASTGPLAGLGLDDD